MYIKYRLPLFQSILSFFSLVDKSLETVKINFCNLCVKHFGDLANYVNEQLLAASKASESLGDIADTLSLNS